MIEWASLGRFLESYSMKSPNHSFMTMLVVMTSISHNTNVLLAWVLNFLFYVFFFIERTKTILNKIWGKNEKSS